MIHQPEDNELSCEIEKYCRINGTELSEHIDMNDIISRTDRIHFLGGPADNGRYINWLRELSLKCKLSVLHAVFLNSLNEVVLHSPLTAMKPLESLHENKGIAGNPRWFLTAARILKAEKVYLVCDYPKAKPSGNLSMSNLASSAREKLGDLFGGVILSSQYTYTLMDGTGEPETWTIARLETPPLIALHAFRDLLAETRGRAIRLGVNREQRIIFWAYGNAGVPGQLYSKIIRELGGCHERTVAPQQHRDRLINTWMRALADQKLRVVFYSLTEKSGITYLRYRLFDEENLIESPIRNREVLCDRLVRGLEINIIRHGNREVSLLLNSRDLLPAEMVPYFRNIRTACRTSFGVLLQDYEIAHINKGLYCALFYRVDGYLTFCIGEFETSGARGICRDPLRMWKVPFGRMESLLNNLAEDWDYKNYTWEHETLNLKETVSYLKRRQLNRNFRDKIEKYPYYNCFLSENWTPDYYRQQARLGFIAATESLAFSRWLMPELEWFYSVLDWNDLVIDKKVRKILRNRREEPLILRIDRDPRVVLENLEKVWKRTWISREYRELIQKLSTDEERLKDEGFAIWGITLLAGERRIPVAGDLGYTIGTTYTSLSGFFHRNMKQYSSYGKLQLIMQAKILERCGLAFWNLGQPYMKYKSDLGAHHEQRTTYLKRWDRAAAGPSPDLSGEFVLHKDLQINWEKHLSRSPYSGEAREDLYEDLIADFTFSV